MTIAATTVIFDYGNTLEMDPFGEILSEYAEKFAAILNSENYKSRGASGGMYFFARWRLANSEMNWKYASHFGQEEPFIQRALKDCNFPAEKRTVMAPEILAEYRRCLAEQRKNSQQAAVVSAVFSALKEKGKRIAILSNDREWAPRSCMEAYGLSSYFEDYHNWIHTSEGMGVEKPDPKAFEIACERMGEDPKKVCYVGDDPVRDIECPKKLGMPAILFVPPGKYKKNESWRDYNAKISERPDAVITDLRELPELIA